MKKIFFSHFFVCAAALTFITFLTGCFNNTLTAPKNTSVSFTIDAATVRQLTGQVSGLHRSARAAEDEHPAQQDQIFIEVSLCGDDEQTQTELLAGEVRMTFDGVLVGAKVYAKAQIYKYIDEEKTQKFLIYRGQSKSITVNNYSNLLSIKLDNANVIVTFNSNGGSAVEQISVPSGVAIEEPDYPVKPEGKKKYDRENYAFMGWYTDEELTVPYNFAKPVTDDLTLYAKWLPDFVRLEGETVSDSLVPGRSTKIRDIFIADHEVTRAEYKEITGKDAGVNQAPANVSDPTSLPVENVSWYYAIVYCNLLSIKEGLTPCYKINDSVDPADWGNVPEVSNADWNNVSFSMVADGYRLPTESEWTFIEAKSRRDSVELSKLEWYSENSSGTTHISKDKLANELCICGVLGNVSEWCFDWYEESVAATNGATGPSAGTSRVVRGGSFNSEGNAESLAALRTSMTPQSKNKYTGFRVVRTIVYKFKVDTNNVTLDPDNGTDVQIQVIVEGDSAIQPANPSRTGYIFEGWCISGTSTVYNFNSPVLQDVKLKAKWTPITYTIKYEMGATTSATTMPKGEPRSGAPF